MSSRLADLIRLHGTTSEASALVTYIYDEVRRSHGARDAVEHLRDVVRSASHLAAGQLGVAPATFLRELAEDLDDVGVRARERANA